MADYYPWPQYQRLTAASRGHGMAADNRALQHSAAAIYRSSWARDQAIKLHGADPARVHVLPLPGNVSRPVTAEETTAAARWRLQAPWRILFNGVDWQRKGGDRAVAILNELVALGRPCELDVVGVEPPRSARETARFPLRVHPRQDLNDSAAREYLLQLILGAMFVLVPSRAETFGFVYCEAMNAGVPPVGSRTGGVPDLISDGRTGLLLDLDESPATTARRLLEAAEPERYLAMSAACRQEWETRFAREVVVRGLAPILDQAVEAAGN